MKHPYKIICDRANKSYHFVTDGNITYRILLDNRNAFISDYPELQLNVYEFSFYPEENIKRTKDERVEITIAHFFEDFFEEKENSLVVIYDSIDGKQEARQLLFTRWLKKLDKEELLKDIPFTISYSPKEYSKGMFLFREDHPQCEEIVEVVEELILYLQSFK